jgi:hypothetical protein
MLDRHADPRRLVLFGLAFLASGLLHLVVWAIDGGAWSGPVSWRKPIVFGLSGGLLSLSLAWVIGHLDATAARRRWSLLFVWAMTVEIFLIDLQRWRGVASHFNDATIFDAVVFQLMGMLALAFSVPILVWTRQAFRLTDLPRDTAIALRGGLGLLALSVLLGVITAVAEDTRWKLAHGLSLHAIQALPLLAWALRRWLPLPTCRARLMRAAAIGYAGLVAIALVTST